MQRRVLAYFVRIRIDSLCLRVGARALVLIIDCPGVPSWYMLGFPRPVKRFGSCQPPGTGASEVVGTG